MAVGISIGVLAAALAFVDPFIGTSGGGHAFPAAAYPFGRMQAGPDTGNGDWDHCAGYRYEDPAIEWFTQNHLNGTGRGDMGDLGLMPFSRKDPGRGTPKAGFDKSTERAEPGYYAVTLREEDIRVEATVTTRGAFWRFSYRGQGPACLSFDVGHGLSADPDIVRNHVEWSDVRLGADGRSVSGRLRTKRWTDRLCAFHLVFDCPWTKADCTRISHPSAPRYTFAFGGVKTLQAKISISTVDEEGARRNVERELPDWDFEAVRAATGKSWTEELGRMEFGGTETERRGLATALYRLCLQPNDISDVDGRYRGADDRVHLASGGAHYSTFSLWDTFRAAHPLYTILMPERVGTFVTSMLDHFDERGYLPIWSLWGKESHCMIANHAVPVIVDAFLKGIGGFDSQRAYRAVRDSLTKGDARRIRNTAETFAHFGRLPSDVVAFGNVSGTLEMCYDAACAARFAAALGETSDAEMFGRQAANWRNVFDFETGFMRPRDSHGNWQSPFDPCRVGSMYTEGNAWQYTWHVLHDAEGLAETLGGVERAADRLRQLFEIDFREGNRDVSGLIGAYAHGNEPSHHIPYLLVTWGERTRAAELIRRICRDFYRPTPDGLCGNDDCGQLSAWYLFSAMGLYPLDPCGGEYVIGAPQVPKVTLNLANGKTFTMTAKNLSKENKYVKSMMLNGNPVVDWKIHHADIMNGGRLVFEMTAK